MLIARGDQANRNETFVTEGYFKYIFIICCDVSLSFIHSVDISDKEMTGLKSFFHIINGGKNKGFKIKHKRLNHVKFNEYVTGFFFRVLHNYMLWRIVAALSEHLSTAFRSTIHEFSREIDGTEQQLDLGRLCLTQANKHFGMALGALFVQQHFSSQSKAKVHGDTQSIQHVKDRLLFIYRTIVLRISVSLLF